MSGYEIARFFLCCPSAVAPIVSQTTKTERGHRTSERTNASRRRPDQTTRRGGSKGRSGKKQPARLDRRRRNPSFYHMPHASSYFEARLMRLGLFLHQSRYNSILLDPNSELVYLFLNFVSFDRINSRVRKRSFCSAFMFRLHRFHEVLHQFLEGE